MTPRKLFDPTNCVNHPCPKIIAYFNGDIITLDCGPGECPDCELEVNE